jgi:signal peptidase II
MATSQANHEGAAARARSARKPAGGLPTSRRRSLVIGVAAVVVVVDQLTKTWALHHTREPIHVIGTLQLALTFNPGAAFGLGRGITPVLVAGAIVLVVVLLGVGRAASRTATLPAVVAMGLLLGGACGNLADRVIRHHHGAVIDFVDLRWWPVFNVADACITVGALLLVLVGASRHPAGGHPGGGHPGGGHPGGGHPGGGHPANGRPGGGHPANLHPATGHPATGHPTGG